MESTVKEFIDLLGQGGVLPPSKLAEIHSSMSGDWAAAPTQDLTSDLLRMGCLTEFQASELTAGHARKLIVGEYVLLDRIGKGGMGQVYRARHCIMKRDVAIKFMLPCQELDEDSSRRFRREVQTASKLSHRNIVTALDAGQRDEVCYLVMELVEGSNLASVVRSRGPLSLANAVDCVLQAAQGLEYAHQQGVVHRDVKPGNLLRAKDGTVKILDMGLARIQSPLFAPAADSDDDFITETGQVLGTASFMAPEQAVDSSCVDKRADIYSLGCTLYYLLVGEPPYPGESKSSRLLAHRDQPPPSLRQARPETPQSLDKCFQRMMAKSVKDRYQDMADVISDLKGCLREIDDGETVSYRNRSTTVGARPARWTWWLAGIGGLALTAVLALWVFRGNSWPPTLVSGDPPGEQEQDEGPLLVVEQWPVDVLPLVDPVQHVVEGENWRKEGDHLITGTGRAARLQLPIECPPQYSLSLSVTRTKGQGPLVLGLVIGDHQCFVLLDRNGVSGIGVDSQEHMAAPFSDFVFTTGEPAEIECRVGESEIDILIDGETVTKYVGDFSELRLPKGYRVNNHRVLFLATNIYKGEYPCFEIDKIVVDRLGESE